MSQLKDSQFTPKNRGLLLLLILTTSWKLLFIAEMHYERIGSIKNNG